MQHLSLELIKSCPWFREAALFALQSLSCHFQGETILWIHPYIQTYIRIYIHINIYSDTQSHIFIHTYIHTHIHTHILIRTYIYKFTVMYTCVYTSNLSPAFPTYFSRFSSVPRGKCLGGTLDLATAVLFFSSSKHATRIVLQHLNN
jgi:hypothetical protein